MQGNVYTFMVYRTKSSTQRLSEFIQKHETNQILFRFGLVICVTYIDRIVLEVTGMYWQDAVLAGGRQYRVIELDQQNVPRERERQRDRGESFGSGALCQESLLQRHERSHQLAVLHGLLGQQQHEDILGTADAERVRPRHPRWLRLLGQLRHVFRCRIRGAVADGGWSTNQDPSHH